jgi:hypothetical protein
MASHLRTYLHVAWDIQLNLSLFCKRNRIADESGIQADRNENFGKITLDIYQRSEHNFTRLSGFFTNGSLCSKFDAAGRNIKYPCIGTINATGSVCHVEIGVRIGVPCPKRITAFHQVIRETGISPALHRLSLHGPVGPRDKCLLR